MLAPGKFNFSAEYDGTYSTLDRYGFDSKLVLRNPQDPTERSILVPLGELDVKPRGCHVRVRVDHSLKSNNTVYYITYTINDTLGRLDCAAEPFAIYKKAQIHAVTSSALQPDLLTGRTGTEEALDLLASAISQREQPWSRFFSTWGRNSHYVLKNISCKTNTNLESCSMDSTHPRRGISTSLHRQAHAPPRVVSRRQTIHEEGALGLAAPGF